jgi:two-component system response regulator NreC
MSLAHQPPLRTAVIVGDLLALPELTTRLAAVNVSVIATASADAAPVFDRDHIDFLIVIIDEGSQKALSTIHFLRSTCQTPVLALYSAPTFRYVFIAYSFGANGHALLSATSTELGLAVATVAQGGLFICPTLWRQFGQMFLGQTQALTAEDIALLTLVSSGKSNLAIAEILGATAKGVEYRISQMCERLQLANKIELAAWWGRRLAPPDS